MSAEPELPAWTSALVGLDEDAAAAHAGTHGATLRVIERDAEVLAMTMDFRGDRINVAVAGGRVTAVHSRG
jgi:ribosomal protein S12 methylthiotransferase accessory factor YcaO